MVRKRSMLSGALVMLAAIFVVLSFTAIVAAKPSAVCTWPTNTAGNWTDASTWSCGSIPGPADDVTVGFGANINFNVPATINSLTMTGGTISGTHALTVTTVANFNPTATTASFNTIGSHLPRVSAAPSSGNATITDQSLTADSFSVMTITGSSGNLALDVAPHTIGSLLLLSGNLNSTRDLTVTQVMSWAGGSLLGDVVNPARFVIASTAVVTIDNGTTALGLYRPLVNDGTLTWLGAQSLNTNAKAAWLNRGEMNVNTTPASQVTLGESTATFTNTGSLRLNAARRVQIDYSLINYGQVDLNSGELFTRWNNYTQRAGHTRLAGGSLSGPSMCCSLDNGPVYLDGGTLSGSGIITGGIQNRGGLLMLTGWLTATGQYQQSVTGTLQVTVTGATNFGKLSVIQRPGLSGGSINIGGTLIVNTANGYSPASGERFQIATGVTANGAFQQSLGNIAPAFSGYAGAGAVVVAEPTNAALVQARAFNPNGVRGGANGYTIAVYNPTTQTLTVNNVTAYVPISFTYQPSSTAGAITANPIDFVSNGKRNLLFSPGFTVTALQRREFSFGLVVDPQMPLGRFGLNIDANTIVNSQSNLVKLVDIAPINIPLGAASNIVISGSTVITQGGIVNLMIGRTSGLNVRTRITCPPEFQPCGNLLNVFVAQEVNGRGVFSYSLQYDANQNPLAAPQSNDYGFYKGQIPGTGIVPGVPLKLFPDWDNHRPCIAYDFSGFGIRPTGCVDNGDPIGNPQLYDPSGIIRDANTLQPIVGATVTLQRVIGALPDTPSLTRDCRTIDTRPGGVWSGTASGGTFEQPGFAPPQISPDVNPQITGDDGRYGWNVVTGCWYVVVEAPGYLTKISPLVGVPPEVTDLDLNLTPLNLPYKVYLPSVLR